MKPKTIEEQIKPRVLLGSDARWCGLPFARVACPSIPYLRSGVSLVPKLSLVVAGKSDVSSRMARKERRSLWDTGTLTYIDRDCELENVSAKGELIFLTLELDSRTMDRWVGDDLSAGALRPNHLPRHIVDADQHLLALMHGMEAEIRNGYPSGPLYAESVSLSAVSYLWGRFAQRHSTRALNGLSPAKLDAVKQYLKANIQNDVTLGQLADIAGLSLKHLGRCFKQATGGSPYQYLLAARIDEAKRLLRKHNPSITEVALAVGFSTPSHFSAAFRKVTGLSPSQYRQLH